MPRPASASAMSRSQLDPSGASWTRIVEPIVSERRSNQLRIRSLST
jgi:hypothetical protein